MQPLASRGNAGPKSLNYQQDNYPSCTRCALFCLSESEEKLEELVWCECKGKKQDFIQGRKNRVGFGQSNQ